MTAVGCESPTPPDRVVYKPRIMKTAAEEAKEKPRHPAAIPLPTGSPLKIETLTEGKGSVVAETGKKVTVGYVGWLADGIEIDTSPEYTFKLGASAVIKGWDQGIVGMKIGEKRRLTIPPDLAYGAPGKAPLVPPDSTLVFELELKEVANP